MKSRKDEFVIIDVREADELVGGKIENSMHMPLGLVIRKAKKGGIENLKGKKICTYCGSGYRGNIAADELNKAGFNAVNLDGGFPSWNQT
ncbi:MAG: rhodanese-like domain-containing protein [Nitrosopumilaceae archaeon]